jgi:hypothetical protein
MTDAVAGVALDCDRPVPGRTGRVLAGVEIGAAFVLFELDLWYFRGQPTGWPRIVVLAALLSILGFSGLRRSIWSGPRRVPARAWTEALAWTVALGVVLLILSRNLHRDYEGFAIGFLAGPPERLAAWLGQKAVAACGQQLVLQGFIAPLSLALIGRRRASAMLASAIFAVLHLPSLMLAAVTGASALVWIGLFRRGGCFGPLVVSHVLLATLTNAALPDRLSLRLRVGISAGDDRAHYAALEAPAPQAFLRELAAPAAVERLWGGDARACVQELHRVILGRPASPREVRLGVAALGNSSPGRLAAVLMTTDEYRLSALCGARAPWTPPARQIGVRYRSDRGVVGAASFDRAREGPDGTLGAILPMYGYGR